MSAVKVLRSPIRQQFAPIKPGSKTHSAWQRRRISAHKPRLIHTHTHTRERPCGESLGTPNEDLCVPASEGTMKEWQACGVASPCGHKSLPKWSVEIRRSASALALPFFLSARLMNGWFIQEICSCLEDSCCPPSFFYGQHNFNVVHKKRENK